MQRPDLQLIEEKKRKKIKELVKHKKRATIHTNNLALMNLKTGQ